MFIIIGDWIVGSLLKMFIKVFHTRIRQPVKACVCHKYFTFYAVAVVIDFQKQNGGEKRRWGGGKVGKQIGCE